LHKIRRAKGVNLTKEGVNLKNFQNENEYFVSIFLVFEIFFAKI
jgi:hypothetical protein